MLIIDQALQKLLLQLFKVDVPIFRSKEMSLPTNEVRIVSVNDGGWGDEWSGFVYTYKVVLENFVRPDTSKPLIFAHTHSVHDLSGQIDSWYGKIENILPEEQDAFLELVHIGNAGLYKSNHLQTDVIINGVPIEM
jgi:hypothetical protein